MLRKEAIKKAFANLKEMTLKVFRHMLEQAPNPKTGKMTLGPGSNIYKDLKIDSDDSSFISVLVNGYIRYIDGIDDNGKQWPFARRPYSMVKGERSLASWRPPISAIIPWMRKNGIPTDNETLYKMSTSIALNGIKARPVFNRWEGEMDTLLDVWLDELIDASLTDLNKYFNQK